MLSGSFGFRLVGLLVADFFVRPLLARTLRLILASGCLLAGALVERFLVGRFGVDFAS